MFALGTQHIKKIDKVYKMYIPNVNLMLTCPTQAIFCWLMFGFMLGRLGFRVGFVGVCIRSEAFGIPTFWA